MTQWPKTVTDKVHSWIFLLFIINKLHVNDPQDWEAHLHLHGNLLGLSLLDLSHLGSRLATKRTTTPVTSDFVSSLLEVGLDRLDQFAQWGPVVALNLNEFNLFKTNKSYEMFGIQKRFLSLIKEWRGIQQKIRVSFRIEFRFNLLSPGWRPSKSWFSFCKLVQA